MTDCENAIQGQVRGLGDWVLVPCVPTDAMLRAAQSAWLNDPLRSTTTTTITMWAAMLAAAPAPGADDVTTKTELLPLPEGNVAHLIAAQVAENEALRAEVKRLQKVVRPKREDECLTLDDWRVRAYYLEENWSRCSRACAIEQDKREKAEARAKQLAEVLSKILENEASDWKAAEEFGGYVLDDELREEARAALEKEKALFLFRQE